MNASAPLHGDAPSAEAGSAPPRQTAAVAPSTATRPRHTAALLVTIPLIWLALWFGGLPFPNGDDPFFAGAAIHLSDTGQLANPWITGWMQWIPSVHLDRFYVHPPFASYVLAAWLSLFGVSAASTTAYACTFGALASTAAAALFLRRRTGLLPATLAASIVILYLLHRGLRPEGLGLALLFLGNLLLPIPRRTPWFIGSLLVLASPFCHAFLIIFALPTIAFQGWTTRDNRREPAAFLTRPRLTIAAGIVIAALFLAAIRFEVSAFLNDFFGHALIVTPSAGKLSRFFEQLAVGHTIIPNAAIFIAVALSLGWRFWSSPDERRSLLLTVCAYLVVVSGGILLYAPFTATYAVMFACFLTLVWATKLSAFPRFAALAPAGILTAWGLLEHGIEYAINRRTPPADLAAIERYVAESQPDTVLFDASALRYVFDFKPPPNSRDIAWSWSAGLSDRWWSLDATGPRDVWVRKSRPDLARFDPKLLLEAPTLFGRSFNSLQPARSIVVIAGAALPVPARRFPFSQLGPLPAN